MTRQGERRESLGSSRWIADGGDRDEGGADPGPDSPGTGGGRRRSNPLAGTQYRRTGGRRGVVRWGQQPGSVYLADQKLPIPVPRVRDRVASREITLTTYERLHVPRAADAGLFRKGAGGPDMSAV